MFAARLEPMFRYSMADLVIFSAEELVAEIKQRGKRGLLYSHPPEFRFRCSYRTRRSNG